MMNDKVTIIVACCPKSWKLEAYLHCTQTDTQKCRLGHFLGHQRTTIFIPLIHRTETKWKTFCVKLVYDCRQNRPHDRRSRKFDDGRQEDQSRVMVGFRSRFRQRLVQLLRDVV